MAFGRDGCGCCSSNMREDAPNFMYVCNRLFFFRGGFGTVRYRDLRAVRASSAALLPLPCSRHPFPAEPYSTHFCWYAFCVVCCYGMGLLLVNLPFGRALPYERVPYVASRHCGKPVPGVGSARIPHAPHTFPTARAAPAAIPLLRPPSSLLSPPSLFYLCWRHRETA